jgi:hypothetical protein
MKERPLCSKQVQPLTQNILLPILAKCQVPILAKHTFAKIYERYAIIIIIALSWYVECLHDITKIVLFINCSQILDLVEKKRSSTSKYSGDNHVMQMSQIMGIKSTNTCSSSKVQCLDYVCIQEACLQNATNLVIGTLICTKVNSFARVKHYVNSCLLDQQ